LNFLSLHKRKLIYKLKKKINIDLEILNPNKSLEELFVHYGTDKSNKGHGYTKFYEKHLDKYIDKPINILEIGSFSGASAASFTKYFKYSKTYCLDVNISNFKYASKYILVHGLDISNKKSIDHFLNKNKISKECTFFDIIIDDGSHKLSDILVGLNFFLKFVKPNGYYIIEDCKFPNYYDHLNDIDHLKIDEIINKIKNNINFNSKILSKNTIEHLKKNSNDINMYKGNLKESDIVFFKN